MRAIDAAAGSDRDRCCHDPNPSCETPPASLDLWGPGRLPRVGRVAERAGISGTRKIGGCRHEPVREQGSTPAASPSVAARGDRSCGGRASCGRAPADVGQRGGGQGLRDRDQPGPSHREPPGGRGAGSGHGPHRARRQRRCRQQRRRCTAGRLRRRGPRRPGGGAAAGRVGGGRTRRRRGPGWCRLLPVGSDP